jgi:anti-anti-sigma factor
MQTPLAHLNIKWHGATCVVSVTGEIDRSNSDHLSESITQSTEEALCLVVDVSELQYLDSAALTMVHQLAEVSTRRFLLVALAGSRARRLLEIAGMDTILVIVETIDAALAIAE